MKRLFYLVIIIVLPVLAYFQYQKYRRFHPPSAYDYVASDSIDVNYHDPVAVQQYFHNVYEIGNFARGVWRSKKVDVRFPEEGNPDHQRVARYYQQLLSTTAYLEEKLKNSAKLKEQGLSNRDIKTIEEEGLSVAAYRLMALHQLQGLKRGDEGKEVWLMQKLLHESGYAIKVDGIFNTETEEAIKNLQQKTGIFPSGNIDLSTLKALALPE